MKPVYKAIVRSLTPWVISGVISTATHLGFHVSTPTAVKLSVLIGTLLTIFVHFLEVKWPKFGILLGWVGAPTYSATKSKKDLQAEILALQAQLPQDLQPAPGSPIALTLTPNA